MNRRNVLKNWLVALLAVVWPWKKTKPVEGSVQSTQKLYLWPASNSPYGKASYMRIPPPGFYTLHVHGRQWCTFVGMPVPPDRLPWTIPPTGESVEFKFTAQVNRQAPGEYSCYAQYDCDDPHVYVDEAGKLCWRQETRTKAWFYTADGAAIGVGQADIGQDVRLVTVLLSGGWGNEETCTRFRRTGVRSGIPVYTAQDPTLRIDRGELRWLNSSAHLLGVYPVPPGTPIENVIPFKGLTR